MGCPRHAVALFLGSVFLLVTVAFARQLPRPTRSTVPTPSIPPPDGQRSLSLKFFVRDFVGLCWGCSKTTPCKNQTTHIDFEREQGSDNYVTPVLSPDRNPIFVGGSTKTISSQLWFDLMWRDSDFSIRLTRELLMIWDSATGMYTYSSSAFFPIDNDGFGNFCFNQYQHNFHFCLEYHSKFTYLGTEKFYFRGDDDIFFYINNRLWVSLGGVHPAQAFPTTGLYALLSSYASQLGLSIGQVYPFDFFFCERHTASSDMAFATSIDLGQCLTLDACGVCNGPTPVDLCSEIDCGNGECICETATCVCWSQWYNGPQGNCSQRVPPAPTSSPSQAPPTTISPSTAPSCTCAPTSPPTFPPSSNPLTTSPSSAPASTTPSDIYFVELFQNPLLPQWNTSFITSGARKCNTGQLPIIYEGDQCPLYVSNLTAPYGKIVGGGNYVFFESVLPYISAVCQQFQAPSRLGPCAWIGYGRSSPFPNGDWLFHLNASFTAGGSIGGGIMLLNSLNLTDPLPTRWTDPESTYIDLYLNWFNWTYPKEGWPIHKYDSQPHTWDLYFSSGNSSYLLVLDSNTSAPIIPWSFSTWRPNTIMLGDSICDGLDQIPYSLSSFKLYELVIYSTLAPSTTIPPAAHTTPPTTTPVTTTVLPSPTPPLLTSPSPSHTPSASPIPSESLSPTLGPIPSTPPTPLPVPTPSPLPTPTTEPPVPEVFFEEKFDNPSLPQWRTTGTRLSLDYSGNTNTLVDARACFDNLTPTWPIVYPQGHCDNVSVTLPFESVSAVIGGLLLQPLQPRVSFVYWRGDPVAAQLHRQSFGTAFPLPSQAWQLQAFFAAVHPADLANGITLLASPSFGIPLPNVGLLGFAAGSDQNALSVRVNSSGTYVNWLGQQWNANPYGSATITLSIFFTSGQFRILVNSAEIVPWTVTPWYPTTLVLGESAFVGGSLGSLSYSTLSFSLLRICLGSCPSQRPQPFEPGYDPCVGVPHFGTCPVPEDFSEVLCDPNNAGDPFDDGGVVSESFRARMKRKQRLGIILRDGPTKCGSTVDLVALNATQRAARLPNRLPGCSSLPWAGNSNITIWESNYVSCLVEDQSELPGLRSSENISYDEVLLRFRQQQMMWINGGMIRNALRLLRAKDVDVTYCGSPEGLACIANSSCWWGIFNTTCGYMRVPADANTFDGDLIEGYPATKTVYAPLVLRDFTCNTLYYDIQEKLILDTTGHGAQDAKNGIIRIPVPEDLWGNWSRADFEGKEFDRFLRYLKLRTNGYKAADTKTTAFIMQTLRTATIQNCTHMRNMYLDFFYRYLAGKHGDDWDRAIQLFRSVYISDLSIAGASVSEAEAFYCQKVAYTEPTRPITANISKDLITFSQDTVSGDTTSGISLQTLAESMNQGWDYSYPFPDVVAWSDPAWEGGETFYQTVDNRRLWAAKAAQNLTSVPVVIHHPLEMLVPRAARRFRLEDRELVRIPYTWGEAVAMRTMQSRTDYPLHGSFEKPPIRNKMLDIAVCCHRNLGLIVTPFYFSIILCAVLVYLVVAMASIPIYLPPLPGQIPVPRLRRWKKLVSIPPTSFLLGLWLALLSLYDDLFPAQSRFGCSVAGNVVLWLAWFVMTTIMVAVSIGFAWWRAQAMLPKPVARWRMYTWMAASAAGGFLLFLFIDLRPISCSLHRGGRVTLKMTQAAALAWAYSIFSTLNDEYKAHSGDYRAQGQGWVVRLLASLEILDEMQPRLLFAMFVPYLRTLVRETGNNCDSFKAFLVSSAVTGLALATTIVLRLAPTINKAWYWMVILVLSGAMLGFGWTADAIAETIDECIATSSSVCKSGARVWLLNLPTLVWTVGSVVAALVVLKQPHRAAAAGGGGGAVPAGGAANAMRQPLLGAPAPAAARCSLF